MKSVTISVQGKRLDFWYSGSDLVGVCRGVLKFTDVFPDVNVSIVDLHNTISMHLEEYYLHWVQSLIGELREVYGVNVRLNNPMEDDFLAYDAGGLVAYQKGADSVQRGFLNKVDADNVTFDNPIINISLPRTTVDIIL